jgi:hypothetical protein
MDWNWIFIIFASIVFTVVLVMFTTLYIELSFIHRNDNSDIQIKFRMFYFLRYTLKIPLIKLDVKEHAVKIREEQKGIGTKKKRKKKVTFAQLKKQFKAYKDMVVHVQSFYQIIQKFCSKIKISNMTWHSSIGLGEASSSAVASGALWSLKGVVLQLINTFFTLKGSPSISVVPLFQVMHSETRFTCMVSFKIGHAILVMLRVMKAWRKTRRSNPINNEYMTGGM